MPQALPNHPEADRPSQGYFPPTPPRPTVGAAVRTYWPLVLLSVLACAAAGAYYAHSRQPVYTSSASLSVGLLDLNTQSVPGFAVGGEVVAGGYSRSVQTDAVIVPAARQLKMPPNVLRSQVTSSPVPSSPIFSVTATGSSAGQAVSEANAVSRSIIAYARARSNSGAAFSALLDRYRKAIRARNAARSRVARLSSQSSTTTQGTTGAAAATAGTTTKSSKHSGQLSQARAELSAQQLRVDSIADQYRSRASTPGNTAVVQKLVDAQGASTDRNSKVQLYGALGALAGLCIGAALAVLIAGIRHRRRPAL
jgi:uncharacterized protein involved in exopolysaccharide biosynthesis